MTTDLCDLEDGFPHLLFHVRRSVRYHMRRQGFFERWQRVTGWISVVSGSAAFATLVGDANKGTALAASFVIVAVQALDLFVNPADMARQHSEYRRRFIQLESAMLGSPSGPTEAELNRFKQERLAIEAEEPPVLTVLNEICHNDSLIAAGYDPVRDNAHFAVINPWKRRLAQWYDFHSAA